MSLDIYIKKMQPVSVYDANATHNLRGIWRAAGIEAALYEREGQTAGSLLPELRAGLIYLVDPANHEALKALEPSNKWGTLEGAVHFLRALIAACEEHPDGVIEVSA